MNLVVHCPNCTGKASCDDSELGQEASCPHCGVGFTLISPAQAARAASAPPPPVQIQAASPSQTAAQPTKTTSPPSTPPAPAPTQGVRKPRETRQEFVKRIRKESSYGNARTLLGAICGVSAVIGLLLIVGAFFAPSSGVPGLTLAVGIITGALVFAASAAVHECLVVAFDIADALIDQRN